MYRLLLLGMVLAVALVACSTPVSPTVVPPTPTLDPLSYDADAGVIVLDLETRIRPGPPEQGRPCEGMALLRVWGDGRVVRVRYEPERREVSSGRLAPTDIHELLVLLDGQGLFTAATPAVANPAGTYCDLRVNLTAGTASRSLPVSAPACLQLLARVDEEGLTPFVPEQALLLARPYTAAEPPAGELPEWPGGYGFSLAGVPGSGRWLSGEVLASLWAEVNSRQVPETGYREGAEAYAVALQVAGVIEQPFDCTLGWNGP